ncbi:hypothetical protein Clacol_007764 [Clathrus columnatus]|uniref:Extracellular membrane protein CFEM domain-containing protein n=1 Tax=Clathrus columnatus TaxID=1419009 RepID=A0AAV5ANL6_9AGAM|nr:hypothetical protein Clacol_007764 [Clathrus columnatus]
MPIGNIPPECQAPCQSFSDITDICDGSAVDVNCLCSDTAANAILSCVNCIANLANTASNFRLQEQQTLDNLTMACEQAGHPLNTTLQHQKTSLGKHRLG